MEKRGLPDGSGGEAAAAQPTRGLGVSTAETRLVINVYVFTRYDFLM